jgi:hypothetical protein
MNRKLLFFCLIGIFFGLVEVGLIYVAIHFITKFW